MKSRQNDYVFQSTPALPHLKFFPSSYGEILAQVLISPQRKGDSPAE